MKFKLVSGLFAGAVACCSAFGQAEFYENPGFFLAPPSVPPVIDAYNFVNEGQFIINFTNEIWLLPPYQPPSPYEMQHVLNYSNMYGALFTCNTGLRLENYNPATGQRQPAANFFNEGMIHCGTIDTSNTLYFEGAGGFQLALGGSLSSKLLLRADNIVNAGDINLGFDSLCTISGHSVNMDHGGISIETNGFSVFSGNVFFNGLIADGYWGLGIYPPDPPPFFTWSPSAYFGFPPPITTPHTVTNRFYQVYGTQLGGTNFQAYLDDTLDLNTSNRWVRTVFLSNTNANIAANVFFPIGATVVEFTNTLGTSLDNLYVFDQFQYFTNFQLLLDGFSGTRPTYIPWNYTVFQLPRNFFFFGTPASPTVIPPGTFNNGPSTNQWSAYEALFQPNSVIFGDNYGQTYSNSPGRIEIYATNFLSLADTRLSSLNFIRLIATNQFGGSPGAKLSAPYCDFSLRDTNGSLTISNLTVPTLNRNEGTCDLYSARWTNVVAGITNNYHVLFVDARFSPYAPSRMVNLRLISTNTMGGDDNMVISDVLNCVSNSMLLETSRLTITTNEPGSVPVAGGLNFLSTDIVWSSITPRLQYLTNYGTINALNTMFFRGSRTSPYYNTTFNEPYEYFLNQGSVTNFSSRIYSKGFESTGFFHATGGSIELHQCDSAMMTNGGFVAVGSAGAVTLEANNLLASNMVIRAAGALTLAITNVLDDGTLGPNDAQNVTNKNVWTSGNGFNLLLPTANGSLLGTTVSNYAQPFRHVISQWAAADRGATPDGFTRNSAVGHLILDGADGTAYEFRPVGSANAMYVDLLDFRNSIATNVDGRGNFLSLSCAPGMTVYFGDALADGRSVAEKLPLVNNGRFVWVSNYNTGFFSSTNMVYPDGTTNRLNRALVTSCSIDSNGNGIPNCSDPAPVTVLSSASISLTVTHAQQPASSAAVSWTAFPMKTSTLLWATSADSTNWQEVTNFLFTGPYPGRVTVMDSIKTNVPRFYKVRISSP